MDIEERMDFGFDRHPFPFTPWINAYGDLLGLSVRWFPVKPYTEDPLSKERGSFSRLDPTSSP